MDSKHMFTKPSIRPPTSVESEQSELIDQKNQEDGTVVVSKEYREIFLSMASGASLLEPLEKPEIGSSFGSVRRPTVIASEEPLVKEFETLLEEPEKHEQFMGVYMVSLRPGRVIVSGVASGQDYLFEKGQKVLVDLRDVGDLEGKRRSAAQVTQGENRLYVRAKED